MEIKIIKNEESKWKFPCKGICKEDNLIVDFSSYGVGVVLDIGQYGDCNLYDFSKNWTMSDFEPIEEEKEIIDWDKVKFPIWARDSEGEIIVVNGFNGNIEDPTLYCSSFYSNGGIHHFDNAFTNLQERNKYLSSLEILPKGTKIEITI